MPKKKASSGQAEKGKPAKRTKRATPKKAVRKKKLGNSPQPNKPVKKRRGFSRQQNVLQDAIALLEDSRVFKLYGEGMRPCQIAETLEMDIRVVRRSLGRTRTRWREDNWEAYQESVDRQEAMTLTLLRKAQDSFDKSTKPQVTETVTIDDDGKTTVTTQTRYNAPGDPRFLALQERIVQQLGQMMGVFDRDPKLNSATDDQKTALVEVIIETRGQKDEFDKLKTKHFDELRQMITVDGRVVNQDDPEQ